MIAVRVILRIFAQAQRQIEIKISDLFGRIFQKRESRAGESLLTEQRRFFKTEPAEKRKNFGTVDKHCLLFFRRRRVPLAESAPGSMTSNSPTPWQPTSAANTAMQRVLSSSRLLAATSPKANASNRAASSGSVCNKKECGRCAFSAVFFIVPFLPFPFALFIIASICAPVNPAFVFAWKFLTRKPPPGGYAHRHRQAPADMRADIGRPRRICAQTSAGPGGYVHRHRQAPADMRADTGRPRRICAQFRAEPFAEKRAHAPSSTHIPIFCRAKHAADGIFCPRKR